MECVGKAELRKVDFLNDRWPLGRCAELRKVDFLNDRWAFGRCAELRKVDFLSISFRRYEKGTLPKGRLAK